jgi:hypothetical protein
MKNFAMALLVSLTTISSVFAAGNKVIYGNDDRQDLSEVTDATDLKLADSTVALFKTRDIMIDPATNTARLATRSYAQEMQLCKSERFYDQKTGAFCSGTLVGPDLILTAGHCITDDYDCGETSFVFGFNIHDHDGLTPESVPSTQVYQCKAIVQRNYDDYGADFTLARIDRAVTDHTPAQVNRKAGLVKGDLLVMIGHPSGLPTKVAANAQVRDTSPTGYFVASTDSYAGNSGSGVFNQKTGLLEGVLVRGEQDFVRSPTEACYISNVCAEDGCRGEDVTSASSFEKFIPEAPSNPGT